MSHDSHGSWWILYIFDGDKTHGPFTPDTPWEVLRRFHETSSEDTTVLDFSSDDRPSDPDSPPEREDR